MLKSPHSLLPETPHLEKPLDLPPIELKTLQVVGRWRGLLKVQKSPSLEEAQYSAQARAVSTSVNIFRTSDPWYAIFFYYATLGILQNVDLFYDCLPRVCAAAPEKKIPRRSILNKLSF